LIEDRTKGKGKWQELTGLGFWIENRRERRTSQKQEIFGKTKDGRNN